VGWLNLGFGGGLEMGRENYSERRARREDGIRRVRGEKKKALTIRLPVLSTSEREKN